MTADRQVATLFPTHLSTNKDLMEEIISAEAHREGSHRGALEEDGEVVGIENSRSVSKSDQMYKCTPEPT